MKNDKTFEKAFKMMTSLSEPIQLIGTDLQKLKVIGELALHL